MFVCPRNPYMLVSDDDPRLRRPASCDSYSCTNCRLTKIAERTRVMVWGAMQADIVRMLTLTWVPSDWQRARWQIRDLVRRLRKTYEVEMAWSIEANPRKTGYHAHAVTWGEPMPNKRIQKMWGGRHIDIRKIPGGKSGYVSKCRMVSGYTTKHLDKHLDINGGRAVHMTRGFLHGWKVREVLQEMSKGVSWHLERAGPRDLVEGEFTILTTDHHCREDEA